MSRSKTPAALYISTCFRTPPDLLVKVRKRAKLKGLPLNTALIALVSFAVEHMPEEKVEEGPILPEYTVTGASSRFS